MDQVELAVALGFRSQGAISNIERERSSIHVCRLGSAARLLSVSTDYLVGLTDDSTPAAELSRRIARLERCSGQIPIVGDVAASDPRKRKGKEKRGGAAE